MDAFEAARMPRWVRSLPVVFWCETCERWRAARPGTYYERRARWRRVETCAACLDWEEK